MSEILNDEEDLLYSSNQSNKTEKDSIHTYDEYLHDFMMDSLINLFAETYGLAYNQNKKAIMLIENLLTIVNKLELNKKYVCINNFNTKANFYKLLYTFTDSLNNFSKLITLNFLSEINYHNFNKVDNNQKLSKRIKMILNRYKIKKTRNSLLARLDTNHKDYDLLRKTIFSSYNNYITHPLSDSEILYRLSELIARIHRDTTKIMNLI